MNVMNEVMNFVMTPAVTRGPDPLSYGPRKVIGDEWQRLVGAEVDVRQFGRAVRKGTVDAATPDGSMVWVARQGVDERTLLHKADGHELWLAASELQRLGA